MQPYINLKRRLRLLVVTKKNKPNLFNARLNRFGKHNGMIKNYISNEVGADSSKLSKSNTWPGVDIDGRP